METLGIQIRLARRGHGYSQDELADRVGVGQQAVSRWEQDKAVPEDQTLDLLRTALGAALTIPSKETPAQTVTMRHLPLKQLDQGQFLALAKTLLGTVYSGAGLRFYPDAGSGIHFRVDTPHGEQFGIRCVTSLKFHPASLDKAVQNTARCANEYMLLVNIPVSVKVRERAAQIDAWRVWDAHDISDLLLQMPAPTLDAAMDLYFPGLRIARSRNGEPRIVVDCRM